MIVEAWGHRPAGSRVYDRPHLLEWNAGMPVDRGTALCGLGVVPAKLERHGMARETRTPLCRACVQRLEDRHRPLPATVLDLGTVRRRKGSTR